MLTGSKRPKSKFRLGEVFEDYVLNTMVKGRRLKLNIGGFYTG
jgi:hypothetical protein